MWIAKEGWREIVVSGVVLGAGGAVAAAWLHWAAAVPFAAVWMWVLMFFRDPDRRGRFQAGELCAPADGTITDITRLDHYEPLGGPATRIGIFLSLFNVHANRMPCSGTVRSLVYRTGAFHDARSQAARTNNEANTLLVEPRGPIPGPVEVRQIAGLAARRIVCHAAKDQYLPIGARFGMIKFGSRTELVIPRRQGTRIMVDVGDKVRAGLSVVARQPVAIDAAAPSEPAAEPDRVCVPSTGHDR
ncbi:MAG: phosphatidylserine decarboxylase [Phycisphaerae bacterium]